MIWDGAAGRFVAGTNGWSEWSGETERVRVVAIGGSASVGKTTCAERVAAPGPE